MAADDARRVLRVPGRLSYGATDLTTAWPHGGTGLGATKMVVLQSRGVPYAVTMEAYGGEPVEYLEPGVIWGLACRLRTDDDDPIGVVFRNTSTGATTQRKVITEPSTVRAGNVMSGRGVKLVFTPEGSTHAKSDTTPDTDAPFVILYRAIPLLREDVDIPLERSDEWAIDVTFQGIRDASGRVLAVGRRKDLTL